MKKQFQERKLVACMELHTFSSLNEEFLKQYTGCMDEPDTAIVYFSPEAIAHKKLEPITKEQILTAFGRKDLLVFIDSIELKEYLKSLNWTNKNLLMMSSGSFNGINFDEFIKTDLRVARVIKAEDVVDADKLIKLTIDLGDEEKTIFAGIKGVYKPEDLVDRLIVVVANLEPRKMRFGVSEGMLLAAGDDVGGVFLLSPDHGAKPGQKIS